MDARTCVSDLARYIEFQREEEERLIEHAKSLTVVVVAAHADAEVRNQEIYEAVRPLREGSSGAAVGVRAGERR